MALSIKISCPHHSRYNPERDGEAGIRGACKHCTSIFRIYQEVCLHNRLVDNKYFNDMDAARKGS